MKTCAVVCAALVAAAVAVAHAEEGAPAPVGQVRAEQPRPSSGARLAAPVLLSVEIVPDQPAALREAGSPERCDDPSGRCDVAAPAHAHAISR